MSFQIPIQHSKHVAARFVEDVRHTLLVTFMESGLSQSKIAGEIGVHRSVIHRELKGYQDMTMGRVAELAWAMGRRAVLRLEDPVSPGSNVPTIKSALTSSSQEKIVLKLEG